MTQNTQKNLVDKSAVVECTILRAFPSDKTNEGKNLGVYLKVPWTQYEVERHVAVDESLLPKYKAETKVKCRWVRKELKRLIDGSTGDPKKLFNYVFWLVDFDTDLPADISNNEFKNYSDILLPDEYISDLKQPTQPVQQSPSAPVVDEWDQQPPSIDQLPPEMPSAEVPAEPPAEVPAEPIFYPYGENWTLSKSDWGVRWGWASHVAIAKMQLNPIAYGIHEATAEEIDAIFLNQTENVFDNHLPKYIKQSLPTQTPKRPIDDFA